MANSWKLHGLTRGFKIRSEFGRGTGLPALPESAQAKSAPLIPVQPATRGRQNANRKANCMKRGVVSVEV